MEYTAAFLRIVMAASPVYILASVMALLLRADGCIRLSSAVLVAAGVANVVFDLLFMGALGFGIEGSALATDAGMLAAVLLSLLYFRWPHRTLHLRWAALCGLGASSAAILKSGAQSALRILFSCVDPTQAEAVEKAFEDLDTGGMGLNLIRSLADGMTYARAGNRNITALSFSPSEEPSP